MFKAAPAKPNTKSQQGMSLLEVMISIAIVSLTITALVTISNAAIASVDTSRNQAIADQYSRQDLEAVRVNRDQSGWNPFLQIGGASMPMNVGDYRQFALNGTQMTYQATQSQAVATSDQCPSVNNGTFAISGASGFYQYVILNRLDTHTIKVSATLCFAYRGSSHRSLTVETLLSDWQ